MSLNSSGEDSNRNRPICERTEGKSSWGRGKKKNRQKRVDLDALSRDSVKGERVSGAASKLNWEKTIIWEDKVTSSLLEGGVE